MICIDTPVFGVAYWFALYATTSVASFDPITAGCYSALGSSLLVISILSVGGYRSTVMANFWSFTTRSLLCAVASSLALIPLTSVQHATGAIVAFATSMTISILLSRIGIRAAVNWAIETGLIARRAVIAGGGDDAAKLLRGLARKSSNDVRIVGIFDDRDETRSPTQVLGVPKLGAYDDLMAFVRASEVEMVIIALPLSAEERIEWLLNEFRVLPVEVRLSAYSQDFAFTPSQWSAEQAVLKRSYGPDRQLTKRIFDFVFASASLAFLWPVMALAALAIRIETPGPVLFRQRRHGYNNREIEVLKFRSMYHHMADPLAQKNVVRNDPRVTRVGHFLRRSSIDELPQLFNVLRGELSLVGPRPHAVHGRSSQHERFSHIVDGYSARHRLPPGITGWAQINGWRGEIDDAQKLKVRVEHDLYYIENWSLWLDFKILFLTPFSLTKSERAY